jgi:hypothetical protein
MKNIQLALVCVLGILFGHVYAQTEYIMLNDSAMLKFTNSGVNQVQNIHFKGLQCCLYQATMDDPTTRNLKYYSNGVNIWNSNGNYVFGSTDTVPIGPYTYTLMQNCFIPGSFNKTFWIRATKSNLNFNPFIEVITICDSCQNYEGEFIDRDTFYSTTTHELTGDFGIVRHANGTDWWIIGQLQDDNRLIRWKMENDTLKGPWYQLITMDLSTYNWTPSYLGNVGAYSTFNFSKSGTKLLITNQYAGMSVFDFNRQTGVVSNEYYQTPFFLPSYHVWHARYGDFSPNERFLYLISADTLYQVDLQDLTPWDNRKIIYFDFTGPYGDTTFNEFHRTKTDEMIFGTNSTFISQFNDHLWRIPYPDSLYPQCGIDSVYFNYLPHVYTCNCWGIPTNPDYDLGPITGTSEELNAKMEAIVYPNPASERLVLELQGADWKDITEYKLMTLQGKECVFHFIPTLGLNTVEADVSHLSPGMYFLKLTNTSQQTKVLKVQIMR